MVQELLVANTSAFHSIIPDTRTKIAIFLFLRTPPRHFVENYICRKCNPCPDLYPNPTGWWLKMWTYRLVFYGINLKILR